MSKIMLAPFHETIVAEVYIVADDVGRFSGSGTVMAELCRLMNLLEKTTLPPGKATEVASELEHVVTTLNALHAGRVAQRVGEVMSGLYRRGQSVAGAENSFDPPGYELGESRLAGGNP